MTPQERLDYLLAIAPSPSGRGRLTHTWVAENVSLAVADGVYAAINSVSVPTAMRYVTGNGIDTTAALWKAQATAVAAADESLTPHLVLLRDFESVYQPRWQVEGMAEAPTLSQLTKEAIVAATRKAIEDVLKPIQQKSTAINGWLDAADLDGYTEAELQTYVDSLLTSEDGNPAGGAR